MENTEETQELSIGEQLSPVLLEIATVLINRDNMILEAPVLAGPAGFTHKDLMNALHIFINTALDTAYALNKAEANPADFGEKLCKLIEEFTTINPRAYYVEPKEE